MASPHKASSMPTIEKIARPKNSRKFRGREMRDSSAKLGWTISWAEGDLKMSRHD
jgi:hypothetical protein